MSSLQQTAKAIGIFLLATLSVVALVTVVVVALDFVLLIFLGLLFSIFLTKTAQFSNRFLHIGYGWNLALVTSLLLLLIVGGLVLLGDKIHDRLQATSSKLDEGRDELVKRLEQHPSVLRAFERIPFAQELVLNDPSQQNNSQQNNSQQNNSQQNNSQPNNSQPNNSQPNNSQQNNSQQPGQAQPAETPQTNSDSDAQQSGAQSTSHNASLTSGGTGRLARSAAGRVFSILDRILSTTLGLIANIGLIFFVGIFIAVDPKLYRNGFARLFPIRRRERVKDILDQIGSTMFRWLMGRFMTMLITGAGTAVALLVLGVPMAITVGVITGLFTFVPNIGAIIGLALGVLVALPQGMSTVGWVVGLYAVLQLLESNVITPLLQQQQTSIPPALLLSFQVIMGALAGFLGLMVATPLLAAALVLIQQAWIKDVLGEPVGES